MTEPGLPDATRRTALAAERTTLAWLRTGLTLVALAVAVGQLLPELTAREVRWPYATLGVAYALLGVGLVVYGLVRGRRVARAVAEGRWEPLDERVLWLVVGVTALLGLASAALIVADA